VRSGIRIATAVVLATAWTLLPIAAALHAAAEPHVYCLEHGAFEEGPPAGGGAATGAPGGAALGGDPERLHAACPFTPVSRARQLLSPPPLTSRSLVPARPTAPPIENPGTPPIAILAVAPKGSPPPPRFALD
jgi:hypothetical protein